MIAQIVFILLTILAFGLAYIQFSNIRKKILLGSDEEISGNTGQRWMRVLLIAFGQKKMFKNWIPAIFHLFIYVAFLLTQIELIEILIDGFLGHHRFFASRLGGFYTFIINLIEVLSLLALVATIIFLSRRNLLKVPRFWNPEMKGWAFTDGNLILLGELMLIIGIFSMNGADVLLQQIDPEHYPATGTLAVSSWLGPALFGGLEQGTLVIIERFGWWLHILVVFAFLNYLPISKHLHLILAFPNTFYSRLTPKGTVVNMPDIMNEVKSMMGLTEDTGEMPMTDEIPEFGANDITKLSWLNLLGAYTCTECGRCTAACPANQTGKKLSPRKIMMDVRDRTEEVYEKIKSGNKDYIREDLRGDDVMLNATNFDDQKSLFDYISKEEIHACTTCNACVEECPVMISPLEVILSLRRYEILTESAGPADWLPMFNAIENGGCVWQIADDRAKWVSDVNA